MPEPRATPKVSISVSLPRSLIDEVDGWADVAGVSRSDAVRRLLRLGLDRDAQASGPEDYFRRPFSLEGPRAEGSLSDLDASEEGGRRGTLSSPGPAPLTRWLNDQAATEWPGCPSPAAEGRQDRCGIFGHPPRCAGSSLDGWVRCTMSDAPPGDEFGIVRFSPTGGHLNIKVVPKPGDFERNQVSIRTEMGPGGVPLFQRLDEPPRAASVEALAPRSSLEALDVSPEGLAKTLAEQPYVQLHSGDFEPSGPGEVTNKDAITFTTPPGGEVYTHAVVFPSPPVDDSAWDDGITMDETPSCEHKSYEKTQLGLKRCKDCEAIQGKDQVWR